MPATYTVSNTDGTNAEKYTIEDLFGSNDSSDTNLSGNLDNMVAWLSEPTLSKKPIWQIEEEIEAYRRMMLNIDHRYEGTKKSIICENYTKVVRKYYHLYKHRSF